MRDNDDTPLERSGMVMRPITDDMTQRTQLLYAVSQRAEQVERTVSKLSGLAKLIGGAVVAIFLAGVAVAKYAGDIAHKADVQVVSARQDAAEKRQVAVETKLDTMSGAIQHQGDQILEVARAVGAPIIRSDGTIVETSKRRRRGRAPASAAAAIE